MKFGVSYNVFNGEEHLINSIKSVRDSLDYINICVQYKSNFDENASERLFDTIREIRQMGLVEDIVEYTPAKTSAQQNEFSKRLIGLMRARERDVDYFTTMDADEYYQSDSLKEAKKFIHSNDLTHTAIHSYLHIKRPIFRSKAPDTTDICFFSKMYGTNTLVLNGRFPANVDPTRRIIGNNAKFYFFSPQDISMHHMNLVRLDNLNSKLTNTPSSLNKEFIKAVKKAYNDWQFGKQLHFPNKPPMDIILVDDVFKIDHIFNDNLISETDG